MGQTTVDINASQVYINVASYSTVGIKLVLSTSLLGLASSYNSAPN